MRTWEKRGTFQCPDLCLYFQPDLPSPSPAQIPTRPHKECEKKKNASQKGTQPRWEQELRSKSCQPTSQTLCPGWFLLPSPHKDATLDGSSLAQTPPCSEELPAFQMQGLGQKSWRDFLASHSRPDSVLCVHSTTFLPGRREGEPHIH